jgi:hypothetical protein
LCVGEDLDVRVLADNDANGELKGIRTDEGCSYWEEARGSKMEKGGYMIKRREKKEGR